MVGYYYHRIPIVFSAYIKKLFEEILVPNFSGSLSYTSSSRASVKRLYILEDKDNIWFKWGKIIYRRQRQI